MIRLITIFCFFCLSSGALAEELYKYTDRDGRTHYVSGRDAVPEEYRRNSQNASKTLPEITKISSKKWLSTVPEQFKNEGKKNDSERLEIFVTSWCPYCKKLEAFLEDEKIPYTRYDIEKSSKGKRIYKKLGVSGVPVSRCGKEIISGFKPEEIKRLAGPKC